MGTRAEYQQMSDYMISQEISRMREAGRRADAMFAEAIGRRRFNASATWGNIRPVQTAADVAPASKKPARRR